MIDNQPLLRPGARFGLTMAEAEAGAREFVERVRPIGWSFDAPSPVADEFESLVRRHVRAARAAQERRDRQLALLLFGIHL